MAETSFIFLTLLFLTSVESASVNFIGYLKKPDTFSALIEVNVEGLKVKENRLWLASKDAESCKDVYAAAKVDFDASEKDGEFFRTLQLLLPVQNPVLESPVLYLCSGIPWKHTKLEFKLPKVTDKDLMVEEDVLLEGRRREEEEVLRQSRALDDDWMNHNSTEGEESRILAFRLQYVSKDVGYSDEGQIEALVGHNVPLTIYGYGFTNDTEVVFTSAEGTFGYDCKSDGLHVKTTAYQILANFDGTMGYLEIPGQALPAIEGQEVFYACLRNSPKHLLIHQGSDSVGLQVRIKELLLPIWIMIVFIGVLLCLSGLFSGLNLGLMALDQTELKIVQNTGSEKEKEYANKIFPIRSHGNFLLCSLLLGNVLVNNTLTILLDTLTSGLVAVIGATMGIVVFGEIIPQAICSRHGLAVGAYTIWLTKLFMVITFPLSFPISKLLDWILGAEIGTVYDKKKLIELLRVTKDDNDLEKEEVDIVTGALVYKEKTVRSVMTKMEDCYMLPLKTILNFETVSDIREQGYSRIPVYDGDRDNIVHVLFAKDLMFIDPDDNMPLAMVCEFYNNDVNFVFHDTPLNVMFNEFKSGEKGHMAFVQDVNTSGEGDPFYETVGLVTLEDIIEEIIQQEIVDETDVVLDNRTKKKRRRENFKSGTEGTTFHQMFGGEGNKKIAISPQLTLAVFQYLTTSIEPFKSAYVSEVVLKRLLTLDIYREIKLKKDSKGNNTVTNEEDLIIMTKGKPIDFFILIIEGKVEVNIGREELIFESGPFTYFGIQTLNQVIESPSSPILAYRAAHAAATTTAHPLAVASTPTGVNDHRIIRKASTQQSIEVPSHMLTNKRSSTSGELGAGPPGGLGGGGVIERGHQSRAGSILPTYQAFVPDYTIKAVTDVLYLKIKRPTYLRALKATLMGKKASHSGELNERELENLLEKAEDESMEQDLNMMLRTPISHSPNQSTGSALEREVTHVKVSNSGASTPTLPLAIRGDSTRMSLASKRSEVDGDEFWEKDHMVALKVVERDEPNGEAVKESKNESNVDSESNSVRTNLLNETETAS